MFVLDTDIVSAVMRRDQIVRAHLSQIPPDQVCLCAPVAAEVSFGLARLDPGSRRRRLLEREYRRLREIVQWIDWTEQAASLFGQHKAELQRRGTPVDDWDIAIGSVALSLEETLVTRNVKHFMPIEGLTILDWTQ